MNVGILLVLASNSPRRRQLLSLGGWEFAIRPADVDESIRPGEAADVYVRRLAEVKARACVREAQPGETIIAADTSVVIDREILGKPGSPAEATGMLTRLRGRSHQVLTAIAVLQVGDSQPITDLCTTDVPMRPLSDAEIAAYVASDDPYDKAGGYAIQHDGFQPVERLDGCFASVMGLPLCHLVRTLRQIGVNPQADIPQSCQTHLKYECPIFPAVLRGENIG
ncbi:MAG: Maf family protein [Chloroflexota bacterium]